MEFNELIHRVYFLESQVVAIKKLTDIQRAQINQQIAARDTNRPSWLGDLIINLKKILRNGFIWYGYKVDVDHGRVNGLSDDDHAQYLLLAGRAGGQTIIGGTASGDDITIRTTSNVTKGSYIFAEMVSAGYLMNDASGVVTGGNSIISVIYPVGIYVAAEADPATLGLTGTWVSE